MLHFMHVHKQAKLITKTGQKIRKNKCVRWPKQALNHAAQSIANVIARLFSDEPVVIHVSVCETRN